MRDTGPVPGLTVDQLPPFAPDDLLDLAGETVFGRGKDYVQYVHGLTVSNAWARASIQAKRVYAVELSWQDGISGACTCPHNAEGNFCKHLVATGLAVLGPATPPPTQPEYEALVKFVSGLDRDALAELVVDLARQHEPVRRAVQARAVAAGDASALDSRELVERVNSVLSVGFVDYRRSFDVAADVQAVLDEMAALLGAGGADAVRPALERAVTRLRKVVEHADDSSGTLGDACQRAADLHAQSCRDGSPDPVKLARWLAKFRIDTPGWPDMPLAAYVDAFDERGLDVYRAAVAKQSAQVIGDRWERFEIDRMILELLDHNDDVDGAIALLSAGEEQHTHFGAIVSRLRAAGRDGDALDWLDRAVAADRVWQRDDEYHLSTDTAASMYQAVGRLDNAIAVRRDAFARDAGRSTFATLLEAGCLAGRRDSERDWALAEVARQAAGDYGTGAAMIDIALAEGDAQRALQAARRFGAGAMWQALADACAHTMPAAAAELYQSQVAQLLERADTRNYRTAVQHLGKVRELFAAMDQLPAFDVYLERIRDANKRRPTFMAMLDRR
jgi:uncharacterized Zn finger protein